MMSSLTERSQSEVVSRGATVRLGADLRAARESLGWTLPAIASQLRIRLPFLEAIEEGRIADLPGNTYAVGFLRTYAKALGLDQEEIVRRFRAEAGNISRKTPLHFPAPMPDRGVPAGALVLVGAVIAILAYAAWYGTSELTPLSDQVQPVPERLAPLAEPVQPVPLAAAKPQRLQPETEPPPPAAPPAPAPLTAAIIIPARALPGPVSAAPPPAPAAVPSSAEPHAAVVPATETARIVLRARSDAWIQVKEKQGQVLVTRVLHPGETWNVPVRPNLLLTTGNAGGLDLLVDGNATAPLGADGAVRRDLPLDADVIRDGKLAMPLAAAKSTPKQP
jgi:cytoskeleton protein RodZ